MIFTISSLHRKLYLTCTLKRSRHNRVNMCNTSSAYHVQRVVCHLVRRDSLAIKFDIVEISFIFGLTILAETMSRCVTFVVNSFSQVFLLTSTWAEVTLFF